MCTLLVNLFGLVLTQMLVDSDVNAITKETLQKFVAMVDIDPTTEDLSTLFHNVRV